MIFLKQAALIFGRKRQVIDANKHLYPISAMCRILGLSRQSIIINQNQKKDESELEEVVAEEFIRSRKAYGSRKKKSLIKTRHSDQPTKN